MSYFVVMRHGISPHKNVVYTYPDALGANEMLTERLNTSVYGENITVIKDEWDLYGKSDIGKWTPGELVVIKGELVVPNMSPNTQPGWIVP